MMEVSNQFTQKACVMEMFLCVKTEQMSPIAVAGQDIGNVLVWLKRNHNALKAQRCVILKTVTARTAVMKTLSFVTSTGHACQGKQNTMVSAASKTFCVNQKRKQLFLAVKVKSHHVCFFVIFLQGYASSQGLCAMGREAGYLRETMNSTVKTTPAAQVLNETGRSQDWRKSL